MIINFSLGGGASDPKKLDVEVFNQFTQDQATVDESQNEAIEGIEGDIARIDSKIDDIELFKFPNATIIGEPTIQNGQISGFSTMNYLQFPFILDLHNQAFQIDFCFTTATNVQTQQNILDSKFGLALAISGGKGLMAISSDGTSWNIGSVSGTMNIESNTTYYARLTWDGIQYKTFLSTDGTNYTQDMVLVGAQAPHPTTIFIGGCDTLETGHTPHPFLGTVNMNKATLTVMGNVIWQGMDDAGLATRLATNLNNIDEVGIERVKEIAKETVDIPLEKGTGLNSLVQKTDATDITNISEGQYSMALGWGGITKQKDSFTYSNNVVFAYLTGSGTTYTINRLLTNATYWADIKDFVDASILVGTAVVLTTAKTVKHFITSATKNDSGDIVITVDSTLGTLSNKASYITTLNSNTYSSIIGSGINAGSGSHIVGTHNFCRGAATFISGTQNADNNANGNSNIFTNILGWNNANNGNNSVLIGQQNKNTNNNGYLIGNKNTNTAKESYLIGGFNTNNGEKNYIFGGNNTNAASANNSLTIGIQNTNNGAANIFNLGMLNTANGEFNHLFGHGLTTNNRLEGAFGSFNDSSSDTLFSVGIGTDDTHKKNGLEIKSDGKVLGQDGKEVAYKDDLTSIVMTATLEDGTTVTYNLYGKQV